MCFRGFSPGYAPFALFFVQFIAVSFFSFSYRMLSEMGYRLSGSGLKRGLKNHIFLSGIGSGF